MCRLLSKGNEKPKYFPYISKHVLDFKCGCDVKSLKNASVVRI